GMMSDNSSCSLSEVYLYDTINDQWDTKLTSGTLPSDRHGFSAILGLDGQQLIIFGGRNQTNEQFNRIDSLYTLNLSNFMWNIPKVSGDIPSSRSYHRANVIDKYMVISFGSGKITSDLFLLDISNNKEYKWIEPNKDHKTNSVMIGMNNPAENIFGNVKMNVKPGQKITALIFECLKPTKL
ncbi:16272_t:CDS:2, partial [Funneliformis caledonium]